MIETRHTTSIICDMCCTKGWEGFAEKQDIGIKNLIVVGWKFNVNNACCQTCYLKGKDFIERFGKDMV